MGAPSISGEARHRRLAVPKRAFDMVWRGLAAAVMGALTLASSCPRPFDRSHDSLLKTIHDTEPFALDAARSQTTLKLLTQAPHPFGSAAQEVVGQALQKLLTEAGIEIRVQKFTNKTPNPAASASGPTALTLTKTGSNILALLPGGGSKKCIVLLGGHYDTKDVQGIRYVGANDSGSSTVGLIEVVLFLKQHPDVISRLACTIGVVLFDGEESLLPNWDDGETTHPAKIQDNTYGSRALAGTLAPCPNIPKEAKETPLCLPSSLGAQKLIALVLLDMIGSKNLKLTLDTHGHPTLIRLLKQSAKNLGWASVIGPIQSVTDDHVPFFKLAIPVINLIDFSNLQFWHRNDDTAENLAMDSVYRASRLGMILALAAASDQMKY